MEMRVHGSPCARDASQLCDDSRSWMTAMIGHGTPEIVLTFSYLDFAATRRLETLSTKGIRFGTTEAEFQRDRLAAVSFARSMTAQWHHQQVSQRTPLNLAAVESMVRRMIWFVWAALIAAAIGIFIVERKWPTPR